MKNRSNVFFGGLLIAVGFLFLAFNYDFLTFSFREVARFWPVLILAGGVAIILHPQKIFFNTLTALCLAFSIPLAIYSSAANGVDRIKYKVEDNFNFDSDDSDRDYNQEDSEGLSYNGKVIEQDYFVDFGKPVERAKLDFGGGAAEFVLKGNSNKLFEAKTLLTHGSYKLKEGVSGNTHEIDFDMRSNSKKTSRFSIDDDFDLENRVELKLSTKPIWDINLGIGAGDLKFDFSDYKVENLEIETGAASVDVTLSDLLEKTDVEVSSGVAKVVLRIPENVGCRVRMDGALNSKDFEGFDKVSSGKWETGNFDTASKRINIDMNSGLSSIRIERY